MTLIDKAEAQSAVRAYLVNESTEIALNVEQIIASLPARGVGVKPPQWKQAGGDIKAGDGFSAWPDLLGAPITIYRKHDGWWLSSDCKTHPTLDAAKAAAQADYEARILSALEPAPAPTDAAQDDDPECTDCGGTGITYQTERRCACQPTDAAQAREAAARLLLDMLHMRNGAHEGVTKDDAQAMWEAASTRVGYAAVDAFLRSIIGEARP